VASNKKIFFYHSTHKIGHVGCVYAIAELSLKPIPVEQRHKKLEVFLFSIVRRRGHQKKVAGQR
jgi:hypothetical protein